MSRYELLNNPRPDFVIVDTTTGRPVKTLRSFDEAMRELMILNAEGDRPDLLRWRGAFAPTPEGDCCDCREKLTRTERACDLYRVALAQIQRTTSDTETAEYAIDKLQEAAAMLNRDSTI